MEDTLLGPLRQLESPTREGEALRWRRKRAPTRKGGDLGSNRELPVPLWEGRSSEGREPGPRGLQPTACWPCTWAVLRSQPLRAVGVGSRTAIGWVCRPSRRADGKANQAQGSHDSGTSGHRRSEHGRTRGEILEVVTGLAGSGMPPKGNLKRNSVDQRSRKRRGGTRHGWSVKQAMAAAMSWIQHGSWQKQETAGSWKSSRERRRVRFRPECGEQLSNNQETGRGTAASCGKSGIAHGSVHQETGSSRQAGAGVPTSMKWEHRK